MIQEQFGEQAKVLTIQFVILPIHLKFNIIKLIKQTKSHQLVIIYYTRLGTKFCLGIFKKKEH